MATHYFTLDPSDRALLENLRDAYVGLEVLAGLADHGESRHVAPVLSVLNDSLSVWLARSFQSAPARVHPSLSVVDPGRQSEN